MHNTSDPKRNKRNIEGHTRACSCPQSTTSDSLAKRMSQQREEREMKAIRKVTEAAREAYEGLTV